MTDSADKKLTIAIAGNPNCGKSALFNNLTGIRQKTGNWPGVTVDRKEGNFRIDETDILAIDLPGIYSLDASSADEKITRDYLLSREADIIINVIDASNLERNLYLTIQMLEMGVPVILALNMMDIAKRRQLRIDTERLSLETGCPVIPIIATRREGETALKQAILEAAEGKLTTGFHLAHEETVEQAATELMTQFECQSDHCSKHWIALKMLEGDKFALSHANESLLARILEWQQSILNRSGEDADILIADTRFSHAHTLTLRVVHQEGKVGKTLSDRIDSTVLNRWLGIPVFLLVMYLMFTFSINFGGAFIDFFDGVAGAFFVDGLAVVLQDIGLPDWLIVLLSRGVGGGLQVIATFIPIITTLYLFLSVVEDSGYMARAAFVMDRAMRAIGLPGKAFVPLIVGFGCNVPAIMATRTLESERERKLTILMNPFMSCGARLPVYALFAAAFFPENGQNLVFGLYLIGILAAIGTGLIMKRTLLPGQSSGFMMELPSYHLPTLRGVLLRTWDRLKLFLKEAGQVIIVMVVIINVLNSIGTDGSFGNEDTEKSVLSSISRSVTPVFAPMGIREENWPATLGIFTGILAKEVVVGTLDSIYSNLASETDGKAVEKPFNLNTALKDAVATIPENLGAISEDLTDPLKISVGDITNTESAAIDQSVYQGVFGAMVERFDGKAGAFAYLLFVLLYFPCVATIAAIKREAGLAWAFFVASWTTSLAYISATLFYQIATFSQHALSSSLWIAALILTSTLGIHLLKRWAERKLPPSSQPGFEGLS